MGRPTTGTVYKRGRYYWLRYMASGQERRISLHTANRQEAEAERDKLLAPFILKEQAARHQAVAAAVASSRAAQLAAERPRLRLADTWKAFMAAPNSPRCGDSTLAAYAARWRMFTDWLAQEFPALELLGEVTPEHAAGYVASLEGRKSAAATINLHVSLCRQVFSALAGKGAPEVNPLASITWRNSRRDATVKEELTDAQVLDILALLDNPETDLPNREEWGVAFALGAYAGCRLADAVGLHWEAVELAPTSADGIGGWLHFQPKKTLRLQKWVTVPVIAPLAVRLRQALTRRRADDPHVTPELAAAYERQRSIVDKEAGAIIRLSGLKTTDRRPDRAMRTSTLGFHSLRYYLVSSSEAAGIPETVVMQIVGHGSPAMTRHYARLPREYVAAQMGRLNGNGHEAPAPCNRCREVREVLALDLEPAAKLARLNAIMEPD